MKRAIYTRYISIRHNFFNYFKTLLQININRFHFTFTTMTVQSKNTKLKRQFFSSSLFKTTFRLLFIIDQIENSTIFLYHSRIVHFLGHYKQIYTRYTFPNLFNIYVFKSILFKFQNAL